MSVVHWDELPDADLARAVGASWATLRRLTIVPGEPLHLAGTDRESVVWALDRDALVVRRPEDLERSVRAEGTLDELVFETEASLPDPVPPPRESAVVRPAELEGDRIVDGRTSITRYALGEAAGAVGLSVELVDVAPGRRSFPVLDLEEVSVVLRGAGQAVVDGQEPWVTRGSVVGQGERFVAGPQGLRVLSFRERVPSAR